MTQPGRLDPRLAEQVRNVAALITWTLGDPNEHDMDAVASQIVDELKADPDSSNVAAFVGITSGLLGRLAEATARPQDELWADIAAQLTSNIAEDHGGTPC